jgi:5-methylcytosine-specific restriction enzyme subunit McrC
MTPRVLTLREYERFALPQNALEEPLAELLWQRYGNQVDVEPPTFRNGFQWELVSKGWVGHIPLTPDLHLALEPKLPIANLFRMLEYAYRLLDLPRGIVSTDSLQELFENVAIILARRVLERARKGLYRAYVPYEERMDYVRGRMDVRRMAQTPWDASVACRYQQHTADIEDNHIIAWTLYSIVRSNLCSEERQSVVRQAFRQLQHLTSVQRASASGCLGRNYHRLNDDYRLLHGLCHFFLDNSGPTHQYGKHTMMPFMVNMARLFEEFVARWLAAHLPWNWRLETQYRVPLDQAGAMHFDIDLVLWDVQSDRPICVLDTKYKTAETSPDISQIISYAEAVGCRHAILIYPMPLKEPLEGRAGDIRFRSMTFDLNTDLDGAGKALVDELADWCDSPRALSFPSEGVAEIPGAAQMLSDRQGDTL